MMETARDFWQFPVIWYLNLNTRVRVPKAEDELLNCSSFQLTSDLVLLYHSVGVAKTRCV